MNFAPSTSTAIVGVSGSGKSTFLHSLASFLPPNDGEIIYKNRLLYEMNEDELLAVRRYDFGMIFQHHYLFHGLSGGENLAVSSHLTSHPLDESLIEKFGLSSLLALPMGSLSGGQQQRLSIARVLTKKPKVIFADEPTGNLDEETAVVVMNLLFSYVKENEATMILVTHDKRLASMCDFQYEMRDKRLEPFQWN